MEMSDSTSEEEYKANERRSYHGRRISTCRVR